MKKIIPKKSLGQNFLINKNIRERIILACDLQPDDTVVEIGPGQGALTHYLSQRVKKVIAIETDQRLVTQLRQDFMRTNVVIIHADVLKYSFDLLPNGVKIIGNLPYNIATPIIEKIIDYRKKFDVFYVMLQLEYAQRILAKPHTKNYGSFSCFVQYYGCPKKLFTIGAACFYPVPKVKSCFLKFTIYKKLPLKTKNETRLFALIRLAFGQRRKTIKNSLSAWMAKDELGVLLGQLKIDAKSRAENLRLEDYVRLNDAVRD